MKVAAIDGGACADDLEVIGDCDSALSCCKDCANGNSVGIAIHRIGKVVPTGENRGGALESRGNAPLRVRQNLRNTQVRILEVFRVCVPARFVFEFFGASALGEVGVLLRSPFFVATESLRDRRGFVNGYPDVGGVWREGAKDHGGNRRCGEQIH